MIKSNFWFKKLFDCKKKKQSANLNRKAVSLTKLMFRSYWICGI